MKLKFLLPAFVLAAALLSGCGGLGKSSNSGGVRLINATDYSALDLYDTDTKIISDTASFDGSSFVGVGSGSGKTFKLAQSGSATSLYQSSAFSVTKDVNYSLVAYQTNNTLNLYSIPENVTAPATGNGRLQILNTSAEAGALDIYLVPSGSDLSTTPALVAGTLSNPSGYYDVAKGTYRLVVTGNKDLADIRLDIASFAIADQQIMNLVLTRTSGGYLVNGLAFVQAGGVTAYKNSSVRMRLVGDISGGGTVAVTVNGVSLGSRSESPTGTYTLVPANTLAISATVDGTSVTPPTVSGMNAGQDITLLVMGSASAPTFRLLQDDNTLAASGYSKVRLVNGINGSSDTLTLTINYGDVATGIAAGTASVSQKISSGTGVNVEVSSSTSSSSLFTNGSASFYSPCVYTIYMLGDTGAAIEKQTQDRCS